MYRGDSRPLICIVSSVTSIWLPTYNKLSLAQHAEGCSFIAAEEPPLKLLTVTWSHHVAPAWSTMNSSGTGTFRGFSHVSDFLQKFLWLSYSFECSCRNPCACWQSHPTYMNGTDFHTQQTQQLFAKLSPNLNWGHLVAGGWALTIWSKVHQEPHIFMDTRCSSNAVYNNSYIQCLLTS